MVHFIPDVELTLLGSKLFLITTFPKSASMYLGSPSESVTDFENNN